CSSSCPSSWVHGLYSFSWYGSVGAGHPQTALYLQRYHPSTFFLRASQHRNFVKLAKITGVNSADELREKVKEGHVRTGIKEWRDFSMIHDPTFWDVMNMDALDTVV
ncbi:hypothetical protein VDP36_08435, partial [Xanthomonas campestris pv. campestris]|nr:hypothetical protein [Xanthomonas campestris pv. campestris]